MTKTSNFNQLPIHLLTSPYSKMFKQIYTKSRAWRICQSIIIISLFLTLILILIFTTNTCSKTSQILLPNFNLNYLKNTHDNALNSNHQTTRTTISDIIFGIAGSVKTWDTKKHYIESWWHTNVTRGFLFLDKAPIKFLPWPPTSPSVRVSNEIANQKGVPFTLRIARVIEETFDAENKDVRWYVMADDDTVFFLENLVEVLNKYDHNGYYYVGMNAESIISNSQFSYEMGYGGAGFALSYPLAEALAKNLDVCLVKYRHLHGSDHIVQACVADLGVSLTQEKGFHQIDLRGNISGLLSAHPQSPLVSLHHLDAVQPIFPAMERPQSLKHLMKAAKVDQSRLLQQSICYDHQKNWSYSLSWGYSLHIYEKYITPSLLQVPVQTFGEWRRGARPAFMMNTRGISKNPCEIPHYFYFDSVEEPGDGGRREQVVTSYVRRFSRKLSPCLVSRNRSADYVEKIIVISPVKRLEMEGARRECCDIANLDKKNVKTITLRPCMKYEMIG